MDVLIGTTNPSKVQMFERMLRGHGITFLTLGDLSVSQEPQETGATPEENARIKAAFYGRIHPRVICNDSGLYFAALSLDDPRQPGLYADDAHMTAALADARAGGLALDAMRPAGLIGLCFYDGGPRGVVTGDGGPGDGGPGDGWPGDGALSGLRVRVPDGLSARTLIEALGARPVPQGAQEAVDGALGPWSVCASFPGAACYWELDHARALSVLLASEMALAAAGVSDTDLTAIVQCAQETQRYQFEAQAAREEAVSEAERLEAQARRARLVRFLEESLGM